MEPYIYWFVLALVMLGLEMLTGTFYLLMVSIAMAVGGVMALLGFDLTWQFAFCGLAGVVGTVILRRVKGAKTDDSVSQSLDVGQAVRLIAWNENGSVRVHYRGAEWGAAPESVDTPHAEPLYIQSIQGSKLILTHHKPN